VSLLNKLGQPIGLPLLNWQSPPPPPRNLIEGRFCRVEPLSIDIHAADLHEANQEDTDGQSWTYLGYGPLDTLDIYKDWVSKTCLSDDPLFFAIIDLADNRAVGVTSLLGIDTANGDIEVGHLHYAPRLQRTPIATEAMYLLMKLAFELGYRRYCWKYDSLNAASRKAALRLGLSYEGVFRNVRVYQERNRDTAWFAAIDTEWPALQKTFTEWLDPSNFDADGRQKTRLSDLTKPIRSEPNLSH
jgi:RimJ/RimL family protein N-acetyltransferase